MLDSDYEFLWPVRVYYEDTDSGGVVYYANYLKFMERARTECLRAWGFEQDQLKNKFNVLFAVRELTISYDKPAVFNDELEVKTSINKLGAASISFIQDIYRKKDNFQLCSANVKIACLDAEKFSAQAIPNNIITRIKSILDI